MNNRLYVGNLSYRLSTDALLACFTECGAVSEARIVTDRETGRTCGFAVVTMATAAEAQYAVSRLDGKMLEGQPIRVNLEEERSTRGKMRSGLCHW